MYGERSFGLGLLIVVSALRNMFWLVQIQTRRNSMGIIVQEFNMWKCAFIGSLCLLGGTIVLKNGVKTSLSFKNPCLAVLLITTTRHIGTGAKAFC